MDEFVGKMFPFRKYEKYYSYFLGLMCTDKKDSERNGNNEGGRKSEGSKAGVSVSCDSKWKTKYKMLNTIQTKINFSQNFVENSKLCYLLLCK